MPPPPTHDEAARRLLEAHLTARHYAPCVDAAARLVVPNRISDDAGLRAAAAAAVAEGFTLLDPDRGAAATACVEAALAGAADEVLDRAAPEPLLAWCIAAAEWCERHGLDHAFARLQARAEAAESAAPVWARVHWRIAAAWHHESFGRFADVTLLLDDAAKLAGEAGDPTLQTVVALKQARLALARAAPETALARAAEVEARADPAADPLWLADVADIRARAALAQGDMNRALQHARRCDGLARQARATPAYTVTYRVNEAYALLGLGACDEAAMLVRSLAATVMPARLQQRTVLLASLFALVRDDRNGDWGSAQRTALTHTMRGLRELDWTGVLAPLPAAMTRLWALALDAGIEPDWVRAAVLARGLAPPEPAWPDAWPWSVRLRVLGSFDCKATSSGAPAATGKAASRPLALLRRLAAESGLESVPAESVAQALWPGDGRVGSDKALETTLARLRRLWGDPAAVLLQDRRLRLNPDRVWIDREALDRLLGRIERQAAQGTGVESLGPLWDDALALWRGPLLADDDEAAWLQGARARLRQRMAAALAATEHLPGHRARCLRASAADPALAAAWL